MKKQSTLPKFIPGAIFILYIVVLIFAMMHHEPWGDELHSWNIAKASNGFGDLISNIKYEGHPPVWYIILWTVSKFSHNVFYLKATQCILAMLSMALVILYSPFRFATKMLLPFGYYFLFEYGVISRNYAIGILLAFCVCIIMLKNFRYKLILYYLLIFLLSNTHLLALFLAAALHIYFLFSLNQQQKNHRAIALHIVTGIIIFLPALYFIMPPSNSQLNMDFWIKRWDIHQLIVIIQSPVRAFIPMPAWWNYNFWNTEFLLDAQISHPVLRFINPVISMLLIVLTIFILKKSRKSLVLFSANILFLFVVSLIFPLGTERYAGFVFIGFITAYWLYCYEQREDKNIQYLVNSLLVVQFIAGFFAVYKDTELPFSNSNKINGLISQVAPNETIVTDYWALNSLAAFEDKPFYCIELHKEISFLLWDQSLANAINKENLYSDNMAFIFNSKQLKQLYMISIHSPQQIKNTDPLLFKNFRATLIDKKEGAIEKGSNLYLYQISVF